jgi:hypothetical protein
MTTERLGPKFVTSRKIGLELKLGNTPLQEAKIRFVIGNIILGSPGGRTGGVWV